MPHDEIDDELTALAVRAGLEAYGQYHETLDETDLERVGQLRRVAADVADSLGIEVGVAAVPTYDGRLRACVIAVASQEHEPV